MTNRPPAPPLTPRAIATAALALALVLSSRPAPAAAQSAPPRPELDRLKRHVMTLAGPAFEGRRGAGGRKAADYVEAEFRRLGLAPLFGDSYAQPIPNTNRDAPGEMGRNIGARIEGADPALKDEWVIVSAHFDHLGMRGPIVFPGADDNASGVAMLLEVARSFAESPEKPRRSVMLVSFDLEEVGLFGSRYFVEHAPAPLEKVALFVTADMIGRSLGGVCGDRVFVFGSENAPGLRPSIAESAKGLPLTVGLLGADLLLINRSDYGPFRARKVPYLFVSTGENPTYHTPRDVPETLDYPKLEAISRLILGIARRATAAEDAPAWASASPPILEEAETIRGVIATLLEHRDDLKIAGPIALLMKNTVQTLDGILARKAYAPDERSRILRNARIILFSVF